MKALRNTVLAAEKAETSIPFVNMKQSILGWHADGQSAIWIQDSRKNWYYAKLLTPCPGLEFTARLGFQPRTMNSLDKFGAIVMPDSKRCPISSLTASEEPPAEKMAGKAGSAK
jgi:hypothetical protein